eukprot:CAMPEP_0175157888 /NCGR_PEP_ID=MMETSP0087-20121206/22484_1 /TAXON_ID=136419 /ORGANISM="Unknown Unknown, Strain D1" /LENGTH=38 /DNA_ID= /DNA_START= /DNA_END= /DNA_ORIENTATION=
MWAPPSLDTLQLNSWKSTDTAPVLVDTVYMVVNASQPP